MRFLLLSLMITLLMSCGGPEEPTGNAGSEETLAAPYDTVAVDSFSAGAISVDVAAQIRMSSQAYQDSLKALAEAQKKEAEAKKAAEILAKEKNPASKTAEDKDKDKKSKTSVKKPAETPPAPEIAP